MIGLKTRYVQPVSIPQAVCVEVTAAATMEITVTMETETAIMARNNLPVATLHQAPHG